MTSIITPESQTERRTYSAAVEMRDAETNAALTMLHGRAVPYDEREDIGWFIESFMRGSLGKSARESAASLPLMTFHEGNKLPMGTAHEWHERDGGLWGTWRLDDTEGAQAAARSAGKGFLNFMSIRFAPIRSNWTYAEDPLTEKDRVERVEARLLETSLVPVPAYNSATVEWVRTAEVPTRPALMRQRWRDELERLRG